MADSGKIVETHNELTATGIAPDSLPSYYYDGQVTGFPIIPHRGTKVDANVICLIENILEIERNILIEAWF